MFIVFCNDFGITQELVAMLKAEELTPSKPLPQEYASYLLSGDWKNPELKHVADDASETQPSGEEVRKQLAEILLAARRKKKEEEKAAALPLIDLFPEADIKIAGLTTTETPGTETTSLAATVTSQEESSTTSVEEDTTTEGATTTTTENPADLPKTGDVELLVEDVTYWGNMIHWSINGQYLAIADIWGQRYLRYAETPIPTTTVPATTTEVVTSLGTTVPASTQAGTTPDDAGTNPTEETTQADISSTTESGDIVAARTNPTTITTDQADTTTDTTVAVTTDATRQTEATTTQTPTTTEEPLPYTLHSMSVSKETVYMLRPQGRAEGAFPLALPVFDPAAPLDKDKVVVAYSERLHLVEWDLNATETSWLSPDIWLNSPGGRVDTAAFMVPSPAWVDPAGRMVVSTHDFRQDSNDANNIKYFFVAGRSRMLLLSQRSPSSQTTLTRQKPRLRSWPTSPATPLAWPGVLTIRLFSSLMPIQEMLPSAPTAWSTSRGCKKKWTLQTAQRLFTFPTPVWHPRPDHGALR